MTAPSSRTHSFLDSPASTSTPTCVSLSFLVQQLNGHQALNEISFLIILSMCEDNHLLDLTRDSHTQQIEQRQKKVSLLYLGQNIKPYTSYGLKVELEILQKKHSARLSIGQV